METNRAAFLLVLLLVAGLVLAACEREPLSGGGTPPVPSSTPQASSTAVGVAPTAAMSGAVTPAAAGRSATGPPLPPDRARTLWPGLYFNADMQVSGNPESATIVSSTSCADLMEALAAGEWIMPLPPVAYGRPDKSLVQALLARGDRMLFVQATRNVMRPLPNPTPGPTPVGAQPRETCTATIDSLSRQTLTAEGLESANGQSLVYPLSCSRLDGIVALSLAYEGPGEFRGLLTFRSPDAPGVHSLYRDDSQTFKLAVGRSTLSYFESLRTQAASSTSLPVYLPWLTDSLSRFSVGDQFAGSVRILSSDPLAGEIQVSGLEDEDGHMQGLRAGFRCARTPLTVRHQPEPHRFMASIELHDEMNLPSSGTLFQDVHTTQVTLRGDLLRVDTHRYEGDLLADGSGTFVGFDFSASPVRTCSIRWTGSQSIRVIGKADNGGLVLLFQPQGPPQLKYDVSCGTREEEYTFPNAEGIRKGISPFIAWPSSSAGTAAQRVVNARTLPDRGQVGSEVWVFNLEAKE